MKESKILVILLAVVFALIVYLSMMFGIAVAFIEFSEPFLKIKLTFNNVLKLAGLLTTIWLYLYSIISVACDKK